ncbi:hypothetical protein Bhyg_11100, partial [Pseudolycoriella hygida]
YPASNKCIQIVNPLVDALEFSPHISLYKGGLIIAGGDGCLRFYKKVVKDWIEQWNVSATSSITTTFCYNMELLLVACVDRNLLKLIDDSDTNPP